MPCERAVLQLKPHLFSALETVEGLRAALQQAIMLEHSTIPTYLYALYSLRPGKNDQIERLIASVVVEEMSHMALACNVLNAIGGSPVIADPSFVPRYPGPLPGGVESQLIVPLERFSLRLVHDIFMEIEEPEDPIRFPALTAAPNRTIGDFYRAINQQIAAFGDAIFTGDPAHQLTSAFSSIDVVAVTDVESARNAVEAIIEQGEGTSLSPLAPDKELAHYYRFSEIYHGKALKPNPEAPADAPPERQYTYRGTPIPFDATGVLPVVANPERTDYSKGSRARYACDAFNYTYTSLLKTLQTTFNGRPDTFSSTIGLMESLKAQALDLTTIELGSGANAGPSFQYEPVRA
jgi:Ferritin-like